MLKYRQIISNTEKVGKQKQKNYGKFHTEWENLFNHFEHRLYLNIATTINKKT